MKNVSIFSENTIQGIRLSAYNWKTGKTLSVKYYIGYSLTEAKRLFRNYVKQFA